MKRLIVCADDFGLDRGVNEAVEEAHRNGILSTASLMVGAPAADDAVARAKRLPGLNVGLHLNLVEGRPLLSAAEIPGLVRGDGEFDRNMVRAGLRFFLVPQIRRGLAKEIVAQFAAFRATGLRLDHVNAHKHMHLHPSIAGLLVAIGPNFGMRSVRVPAEPVGALHQAFPAERRPPTLYRPWIELLRRRLGRAGIATNDHVFGLAWSGAMTEARVLGLLPHLPDGISEIYFHPTSARRDGDLAALLNPAIAKRIAELGIVPTSYGRLAAG